MNDTSSFFSQNSTNAGTPNDSQDMNNFSSGFGNRSGGGAVNSDNNNPSSSMSSYGEAVTGDTESGFDDTANDTPPTNDQDSQKTAAKSPTKEKPTKELSATEKQIRDAEEKLRKLKEKDKIQKRKMKEKNEKDILKVLRSKGLLKVSVSEWEDKISEVAEVFS